MLTGHRTANLKIQYKKIKPPKKLIPSEGNGPWGEGKGKEERERARVKTTTCP